MTGSGDDEVVIATYQEIAARWRLASADVARMKAKRRKWLAEPRNDTAAIARIRVPRSDWDAAGRVPSPPEASPPSPPEPSPIAPKNASPTGPPDASPSIVSVLADAVRGLQEDHDRLVTERDTAVAAASAALAAAGAAETRAQVTEVEARMLREALAEARRPWWRRVLGD